jgi:adenosine deaminase
MITRRPFVFSAALSLAAPAVLSWPALAVADENTPSPADPGMAAFIEALPKVELHVHLEGTLEAEMKFRLAKRNGLTLPYDTVEALKASYVFHDLPSFLKVYYEGNTVLIKEQDFYDLCYAYLTKAASQNVIYAEMFFDPQQHIDRGIALTTVMTGFTRARRDAKRDLGIESQLILCFMRDLPVDSAMAVLDAALPFKADLIGVGLDSDELNNPPDKFRAVFAKARAAGLHLTLHCDVNQKDTGEHIRQALEDIGVERIDHGGNVLQRPDLIRIARERKVAFTVCPISSGEIMVDGRKIDVVRGMLDQGLRVTVNADDPAYMGGNYIGETLIHTQAASHLTRDELVRISRNAIEAAWIDEGPRQRFLDRLDGFARQWGVARG